MNSQYTFINKIDEKIIQNKVKNFVGYENILNELFKLADVIFNEKNLITNELAQLFNINGNVLLSGKPGEGKTSIAYKVSDYILTKYGVESYYLSISDIIKSNLGLATSNMKLALSEIKEISLSNGSVIVFDEIDRFCVNRNNENELSEMKRLLIEVMDFLDNITLDSKTMVIGITNVKEALDLALIRRFEIQKEIKTSTNTLKKFVLMCNERLKINVDEELIESFCSSKKITTCDEIKKFYKSEILREYPNINKIQENIIKRIEEV